MPAWLATDFRSAHMAAEAVAGGATDATSQYLASALTTAPHLFGFPVIANLPAFLIVALITVVLVIGIREIGQLEQRDGAAQDRHHPVLLRGGRLR